MNRPAALDPVWGLEGFAAAMVVAGFVVLGLTWRLVARLTAVPYQLPYLVSGGLGGFALIVTGSTLAYVQLSRRLAAEECTRLQEIASAVEAMA